MAPGWWESWPTISSYAGNNDRKEVSQFLAQYFVNYNLPDVWYLTSSPIITTNWEAESKGNKWTVPVGGGFGKVFHIGKLPFNGNVGAFANVVRPDAGPDWTSECRWPCFPQNLSSPSDPPPASRESSQRNFMNPIYTFFPFDGTG
jgi:hypothetical protein